MLCVLNCRMILHATFTAGNNSLNTANTVMYGDGNSIEKNSGILPLINIH